MSRALRVTLGRRTLARIRRGAPLRKSWRTEAERMVLQPRVVGSFFWSPQGFARIKSVRLAGAGCYVVSFRIGNLEQLATPDVAALFPSVRLGRPCAVDRFDVRALPEPGFFVEPSICVTVQIENRGRRPAQVLGALKWAYLAKNGSSRS